jgi:hypothetical protein
MCSDGAAPLLLHPPVGILAAVDENAERLRIWSSPALTGAEKNLLDQLPGPRNERMFEFGLRETRATSFVGVVQLPQTTLQVLPKMYRRVLDGRDGPPGRPPEDDDAARPAVTPLYLQFVVVSRLVSHRVWERWLCPWGHAPTGRTRS